MDIQTASKRLYGDYGALTGLTLEQMHQLTADGVARHDTTPQCIYNGLRLLLSLEYGTREYFTDAELRELSHIDQQGLHKDMLKAGIIPRQADGNIYLFLG